MSQENYLIVKKAIRRFEEGIRLIELILRNATSDEIKIVRARLELYKETIVELELMAKALRPSQRLINWGKGQAEAAKNYNPVSSKLI